MTLRPSTGDPSRLRRATAVTLVVVAVLGTGCRLDGGADPDRAPATVSETLPEDAGDLENPEEVVSPGGGAGETEESGDSEQSPGTEEEAESDGA